MQYITSKCPHCKFKIRNWDSETPKVQIGLPVFNCPSCKNLVFDSIITEYEFMTENEKKTFVTHTAVAKSFIGNILYIALGIFLLIACAMLDSDYTVVCLLGGVGSIVIGIYQMVKNNKNANDKVIEQWVYESLIRTSNDKYVNFLSANYASSPYRNRKYLPAANKELLMNEYKIYVTEKFHRESAEEFAKILNQIETIDNVENISTTKQNLH